MNTIKIIAAVICGYLIGSFSFSITISSLLLGGDVRGKGSGNAGATNMARTYGILPGLATLAGDLLKTFIALRLGRILGGDTGFCLAGIACVFGHCYPVYYGFKGGKAVSSGLAVCFACDWRCGAAALIVFAIVAFSWKKVSAGSVCAAAGALVTAAVLRLPMFRMILILFTVAMLILRHAENIRRIINGTEPDFRLSKKK